INIRKEYYEAIIAGYLEWMEDKLTEAEKKYIHHAGLLIIYMQSLRFLTDYLSGDVYYRTTYPEHNYGRAKNQLSLLISLEEFLQQEYNYSL
ncbi:MAG: aminoglycoside phosphotransferase family protein, partial [Chitinophagaceae bacterium]